MTVEFKLSRAIRVIYFDSQVPVLFDLRRNLACSAIKVFKAGRKALSSGPGPCQQHSNISHVGPGRPGRNRVPDRDEE